MSGQSPYAIIMYRHFYTQFVVDAYAMDDTQDIVKQKQRINKWENNSHTFTHR